MTTMTTATSTNDRSPVSADTTNTSLDQTKPNYYKVKALLEYWSENRGTVRSLLLAHMQPRCTLHHVVKATRQRGELWDHNDTREPCDDELMAQVDEVLASLPEAYRAAVLLTYVNGRGWSVDKRAQRLGVSKATYYRHLQDAHNVIDESVDWRDILIV
jgi:DNA-directed RNA polymerase specialized sigma24 family protein